MYGYAITVNGKVSAKLGDISYKNIICSNRMIEKFEQDKVFVETDELIIILDGVILNRKDLISESKLNKINSSWVNTLVDLYSSKGETFFSVLRGSFSGAIYDKSQKKWIIFGDQLGSKFTYYSKVGDFFCVSEEMGYIYEILKANSVKYNFNEVGAWMLLTYGYMLDDVTLCKEVHKINPGCYITYYQGVIEEHRYYLLDNTSNSSIKEEDAIDIIDKYFRQAIKREFDKDDEYGYKHVVALSGGLDCRMTSFVAHSCGYEQQLNITFSQTDYWDQTLPMRMSSDLCHEWLFKSLDNGLWLYDVDNITKSTGGNVLYYGTAHANSLHKYINYNSLGLVHSGQLGDVIIGSWITKEEQNKPFKHGYKAYSQKYLDKVKKIPLLLNLNKELGLFYYRGLNGTNNGIQNVYNYTETLSPFLDLDFIEHTLVIPIELRQHHFIYKKWILDRYPQASEYEWETTGRRINTPVLRLGKREIPLANIPNSIYTHIRMLLGMRDNPNNNSSMNPIAYYLAHNNQLSTYLNGYFTYADAIKDNELKKAISEIGLTGTAMEKIQAVSLLSAIKLFFI